MFEINLVPDVKAEMIRAQKKRNVVFVASVAVSVIAAAIVVILMFIKIGQDLTISNQDSRIKTMSEKINSYDGLSELLTVQKQLSDLKTITANKNMLSRVFNVLHSITAFNDGDEVNISSLDVDLTSYIISFDGQANAGPNTDGFDFRVLEMFTKTVESTKFDYGRYVDKEGREIPTMCIFESNSSGKPFSDEKGIYAIWAKGAAGCDPAKEENQMIQDSALSDATSSENNIKNVDVSGGCNGSDLICIYRTPQFTEWYRNDRISLDGNISGVEHFESQCIAYRGEEKDGTVVWKEGWKDDENKCLLAAQPVEVPTKSNGRETGGDLVLMFSSYLYIDGRVFNFNNKHMITITPSGKQNVTDSFTQIEDMFAERAKAEGAE